MIHQVVIVTHPFKDVSDYVARVKAVLENPVDYDGVEFTVVSADALEQKDFSFPPVGVEAWEPPRTGGRTVVVLGGDGTFATAVRKFAPMHGVSIIGIQTGNVNFYNTFTIETFEQHTRENTRTVRRETGQVFVGDVGGPWACFANDVVLKPVNPGGVAEFSIGGNPVGRDKSFMKFITQFRGDGVIFSTHSGSTAYNMSVGGPIVHPAIGAFIISPIAPITLASRPVVVPGQWFYNIQADQMCHVIVDGIVIAKADSVTMCEHHSAILRVPKDYDFFEQAREKLGWHK